jgi:pSer/pThr/pTyr-binding forkhead associated (FHA) protein
MIVCPNCKHENPEGANSCEACYTTLPAIKACPTCGASVQIDATFCGQCGQSLIPAEPKVPILSPPPVTTSSPDTVNIGLPPTILTNPAANEILPLLNIPIVAPAVAEIPAIEPDLPPPLVNVELPSINPDPDLPTPLVNITEASLPPEISTTESNQTSVQLGSEVKPTSAKTQLQQSVRKLLHLQTNTVLEIPIHLPVVQIGKPNDQVIPDIDVSGFPAAEVVSRNHASIRIEGDNYYIEDLGSANGTYINHNVLAKGNRHLLHFGDRISLGKGDLVTFVFQSVK